MVTIDCADALELATFYSKLLGMDVTYAQDNMAMITGSDGPAFGFGGIEGYHPPAWPDENTDKQFHLDLKVADIPSAEEAAVALGATVADPQPGETWRVLLDPAGHPFCLARWDG